MSMTPSTTETIPYPSGVTKVGGNIPILFSLTVKNIDMLKDVALGFNFGNNDEIHMVTNGTVMLNDMEFIKTIAAENITWINNGSLSFKNATISYINIQNNGTLTVANTITNNIFVQNHNELILSET